MNRWIRLSAAFVACSAFAARAADITGDWHATIVTATGPQDYTYTFRQNGGRLFGTAKSQDGVVPIANGFINYKTITFDENVPVPGRRAVLEYTGELVSDDEIKFKRQVKDSPHTVVEFVARRTRAP